jgi:hypothetical protein
MATLRAARVCHAKSHQSGEELRMMSPQEFEAAQLRFEDEDEDHDGDAIDGIRNAALVVMPLYLLLILLIWWL